jgi:hypothetical protein
MTLFLFYSTSTLFYPCSPVPLVSALFGSTRLLLYSTFVHVYLYCRIYLTLPDSTSILFNLYCASTLRGLLVSPFYSSRAEPCCSTPRCSAPRCRLTKGFFPLLFASLGLPFSFCGGFGSGLWDRHVMPSVDKHVRNLKRFKAAARS